MKLALALLPLLFSLQFDGGPPSADDPLARTVAITLRTDDPVLEDHGPSRRIEHTIDFSGTLYLWTSAKELDGFLRVEDGDGKLLGEDDDSGGGKTPFLSLEVEPGRKLIVTVAASKTNERGECELHLIAARESAATRAAADTAMAAVKEAEDLSATGELERARDVCSHAVDELIATQGARQSAKLAAAAWNLGFTSEDLSDPENTLKARRFACAFRVCTLPEDHPERQKAWLNLATAMKAHGDIHGAREIFGRVVDVFARTLPDDHRYLQIARQNLAVTMRELGDPRGARAIEQKVLEIYSRTLPDDHPDLQRSWQNLAITLRCLGDPGGARELEERVLAVRSRTLPEDHPDLQAARQNLAVTLAELGDLYGARELLEKVLEVTSRTLPEEHLDLQTARGNLAAVMYRLGDVHSARELFETTFKVLSRTLPDDHPDLQTARLNLATAMKELGDPGGARALDEKILDVNSRTLPDDHLDLQISRLNLAVILQDLGDLHGARELEERALEVWLRTLPEDDLNLQVARQNLASTMRELGDLQRARELEEKVLAVRSRTLPDDHPSLQEALKNMMWTWAGLGANRDALDCASRLAASLQQSIAHSFGKLSPRELEERVELARVRISGLLSLARGAGVFEANAALERQAFALVESSRAVGLLGASIEGRAEQDADLARLREEETRRSGELARLAQAGSSHDEISAARLALDQLRRERLSHLAADPATRVLLEQPSVDALAPKLAQGQAIVSYWRYKQSEVDSAERWKTSMSERLLAYVLRHDGKLVRVELGSIEAIQSAVTEWRDALRSPRERGLAAAPDVDAVGVSGEAVRELVFDPLLPALEGVRRLIVAQDDELHAVPLEALPWEDGLLGERFAIELHLTLRELLWPKRAAAADGSLVALGGPSFNSQPETWKDPAVLARAASGAEASRESASKNGQTMVSVGGEPLAAVRQDPPALLRVSPWARGFEPLTYTGAEARGVAALYEEAFAPRGQAVVLEKKQASRAALEELAPRARYLHLATHGWFAPESIPSISDPNPLDTKLGLGLAMSREEQVRGLSPMLLCGLALAGANLEKDELGRVPGIITAEEIASFDLSNCDLAVLSACDTNVGVRRAGQGVASLQKALHMAGARSVITSLWKVPDEATKELMLDFYRRIWIEKKPKHQALWEAKMALRARKDARGQALYSTRDWAAWVLTGNPD